MNLVIRRSALILSMLAALLLSACAGGSVDALSVGERSISHDDLVELVQVADPGSVGALETQSADLTRAVSNDWLIDGATAKYLELQGIELTEGDRNDAGALIAQAVSQGQIGAVSEGTPAYEFFIQRVWISGFTEVLQADPEATDFIFEELDDAQIASNIGVWDPTTAQILPPILGN